MALQLYSWQSEALNELPKNVLLAWETGTGKTLGSLEHYRKHSNKLPLLIIAPPAKVNSKDWEHEITNYLGNVPYKVTTYGKLSKLDRLPEKYAVIYDEFHLCKSSTSQRGKLAIKIATDPRCHQFIGLSATFIPNGYIDLQTYGIIFGWWGNKTEFLRNHVLIDRSRGYPRIIGYSGEDKLKQLWNSVAFGLDKTHLNLPDLINITTTINLSPKQQDAYRVIKNTRMLEDGTLLDTPSKLHATLRQFLAHTRIQALEELFESTTEHILVFYNYNVSREAIRKTAEKHKRVIYEQSGHLSDLPKSDPVRPSVTLLQYMSGSVGLNLQYAAISVFYEPSYSYQDMHQASGRNYRGGTTRMVRHYYFKVLKTIDTSVYACLERKVDFNERIISKDEE